MKRFQLLSLFLMLFVALFVLSSNVFADEAVFEISRGEVLHDPDSQNMRFLFRPNINIFGESTQILKAVLSTDILPLTNDTTFLEIRIYPLTTNWNENNVTWINPWSVPGGDFDELQYAHALVTLPDEQEVTFNLTDLFQRFCDGRLEYYGLLVSVSTNSWDTFTLSNLNSDDPLATINVVYFE